MGYGLYGEQGYIQDVASIGGWWDLITTVDKRQTVGPLVDFLNTGKTTNPSEVVKAIDTLLPDITDTSVRNILKGLRTGLLKTKEIAIVSG
jgi:hypothetical protein